MAFKTKTDYFGFSDLSGIVLSETSENRSAQVAEAQGENGFNVASEVYGERIAPACSYIIKGRTVSLGDITLGKVNTVEGKSFCVSEIAITTGAGQVPTMSINGQQIEDNATEACTTIASGVTVTGLHHAQTFGAFEISGQGAHLTNSSWSAQCTINTADKDGVMIAHDITDGRMTVTGTIQVSNASYPIPTLSVGNGWILTSPLSETNPNGDYPTYGFTLTKYLTAIEPNNN